MRYVRFARLEPDYDIPWCRVHLKRKVVAGEFPAPVELGPNTIAWLEEDILAWKERIRQERDAKQQAARQRAAEKATADTEDLGVSDARTA